MPKIFVSYRRMDSEERAHRIADWLVNKYGWENVFIDVDRIGGGADFVKAIEDSLAQTDVLLVIIGDQWVDELTRRSAQPEVDFVRLEVRTGLEKIPLVIPILTHQDIDIRANQLPDDIRTLTRHNFRFVRGGGDFHRDLALIKEEIDEQFAPDPQPEPEPVQASRNVPFIPILVVLGIIGAIIVFGVLSNQGNDTGVELTQVADEPTLVPLDTDEPTDVPTLVPSDTDEPTDVPTLVPSDTDEPTATETPNVAVVAQTLVAQQTAEKIIINATATAEQKTLEAQQTLTQEAVETATATVWTKTPTPDFTASVAALLTQWADGTLTQQAIDLTATATLWTATPTPTFTPTVTFTPSHTPTFTPTFTPTLSPEQIAMTPVTQNDDWTVVERDFDGVTMVLVPVGCFMMGSVNGDDDEQPVHEQCVDEPFWIDKYEVTNEQYGSLSDSSDSRCIEKSSNPNQPRICASWVEAQSFCGSKGGYLPIENEWEYVARGPDNLVYPWGNNWNNDNAVFSGNSGDKILDVGSHPNGTSWVGALDMTGNLLEYVNSRFQDYPFQSNQNPTTTSVSLRGGSFKDSSNQLLATSRSEGTEKGGWATGFRCARAIDS